MIFGKKYNVHFDFYSGIIIIIMTAVEKNVTNPQVNNGRGGRIFMNLHGF